MAYSMTARLAQMSIWGPSKVMVAVAALAAPVAAQEIAACSFTQECIEGEACADTNFDLSVAYGGPETDQWAPVLLVSDAETLSAHRNPQLDGFVALGGSAGQSVMLSSDDSGARYTVHLNAAEMSITYIGTCEVQ